MIYLNTDGGSRGNPGPAGIGLIIRDSEKCLKEYKEYIGSATNNIAEYKALIKGLEIVYGFTKERVQVFMDSELIVRQLNGIYQVRNKNLIPLFKTVKELEKNFLEVKYKHVRREDKFQQEADRLVNEALDEA